MLGGLHTVEARFCGFGKRMPRAPPFMLAELKKKPTKQPGLFKLNVTVPVPFVFTEKDFTPGLALSLHGVLDVCTSRHRRSG